MIFLLISELYLRVQRSLRPQASTPLLMRDDLILDQILFSYGKMCNFLSFSFVEEAIHIIVGLVPENLMVQEFFPIFNISKLF